MEEPFLNHSSKRASGQFDREDWASAYGNVEAELTNISLKASRGKIPTEMNGFFYKNGPGRLERNGHWVHHPFDGDGMISAVQFSNGEVNLTNRFVRTKAWQEEEVLGKFLYRGVFGTQKEGGIMKNAFDVRLKNIANTNVVKLGNDLLALWEAAEPHALDPITLETKGISNLEGTLKKGEAFSAHPRFDPGHYGQKRMVSFGVKTGPKSTIRLMEFEVDGTNSGKLISDRQDTFNGFAFLHDFAITPNWAIFLQNAIAFNPIPFLLGQKGAGQCLSSQKNGRAKFWLIPRNSGTFAGESPRELDAPDGFVFHHLNAWEEGEEIIIDSIYYRDFPSIEPEENFREINFDSIPEGILKRCQINSKNNKVKTTQLSPQCCEFAMVNPRFVGLKGSYSWMASAAKKCGNGPLQSIKKIDLKSNEELFWSCAPRGFVSEPLMVPKPNSNLEDDGWVLVLVWNGCRRGTDLVILNASNLHEEAVIELPLSIPHGLHGTWVAE